MTSTLTIQARFAVLALQRLLTGLPVAAACFLASAVVASAQTPPAVAARAPGDEVIKMQAFVSTGTRFNDRTVTDSPVPIDVVTDFEIRATGLTEPAQVLQRLVPSVNFPRTSISDGTDSARPLTLRGLAPDQLLVLVNGKRRHASALINVNGTVGRGSGMVDLNATPPPPSDASRCSATVRRRSMAPMRFPASSTSCCATP